MAKTREIKSRMKAVANIQRITKTMQMIATARYQASYKRAQAASLYSRKMAALVEELTQVVGRSKEPLLERTRALLQGPRPGVGRELLLVLTSNRGLCGGYNANVLRVAAGYMRDHGDRRRIDLEVVGKKGLAYFKFMGTAVAGFHSQFTDRPACDEVDRLAQRYAESVGRGELDAVRVVYMSFQSASRQKPCVLRLLPLQEASGELGTGPGVIAGGGRDKNRVGARRAGPTADQGEPPADYDFSPPPQRLLDELLPTSTQTRLFQCFNEAVVSEHLARMVAMKSATDNAGKMHKDLTRRYNRARQSAITTELSEIIGGSAALA